MVYCSWYFEDPPTILGSWLNKNIYKKKKGFKILIALLKDGPWNLIRNCYIVLKVAFDLIQLAGYQRKCNRIYPWISAWISSSSFWNRLKIVPLWELLSCKICIRNLTKRIAICGCTLLTDTSYTSITFEIFVLMIHQILALEINGNCFAKRGDIHKTYTGSQTFSCQILTHRDWWIN